MNRFTLASIRDAVEIKVYPSEKTEYEWYEASERVTGKLWGFLWQVTKCPALPGGWCDNNFDSYYCSGEYSQGWYTPERLSHSEIKNKHFIKDGNWWTKPRITIYWSYKSYDSFCLEDDTHLEVILGQINDQRPDLIKFDS